MKRAIPLLSLWGMRLIKALSFQFYMIFISHIMKIISNKNQGETFYKDTFARALS